MDTNETKYAAVRRLILDAAAGVFERLGFDKTTVNDIADAVHKAKSSIYYYFKSKEEIFLDIVEEESRWIIAQISQAVEGESNPVSKLRAYLMTRITQLRKVPNLRSVLADGYLRRSGLLKDVRANYDRAARDLLSAILREGKWDDILSFASVELATVSILAVVKGLELPILFGDREPEPSVEIDSLVGMLVDGIRTRESPLEVMRAGPVVAGHRELEDIRSE